MDQGAFGFRDLSFTGEKNQEVAVLIEGGFMSNMSEAKQIATPAYRQRLAEAIADGLSDYRSTLEKLRTAGKGASP